MSQEQSHSQSGNTNAMGTHVGSSHAESTHVLGSSHGSSHVQSMIRYIESLPDEISILDEVKSYQFWKAVRTEFLATFLLIIFGCGSMTGPYSSPHQFPVNQTANSNQTFQSNLMIFELKVSLVFGLIIATLVQCMGQVSGAHMNPAVTLSLFVTRRLTLFRFSMYLFAQSFGSIFACLILFLLKPSSSSSEPTSSLGFIQPLNQINLSQAFGYEFLSTFIVVLTHLANCDQTRTDAGFKSLSIGFSYSVAHLFAFRYTGAGLNPVRALGPAVMNKTWDYQWLYWVGPLIGGMLSGFTYEYIKSTNHPDDNQSLKSSFRRKPKQKQKQSTHQQATLRRDHFSGGVTSNETELTITSNDIQRY